MSKSAFQPDWLALREPADHAARDAGLLARAAGCVGPGQVVLDLGSGTGSTVRAFSKAGFPELQWRLMDNDPVLLDVAQAEHPAAEVVLGDLADIAALPLDRVGLVTCSALLDLMPSDWVVSLAARLAADRVPFYGALSYDGVMTWDPVERGDTDVTAAFNAHQRGDKGLGPALGPDAGPTTAAVFAGFGYDTDQAQSPWQISSANADLHCMLLDGIGAAVAEAGVADGPDWAARRKHRTQTASAVIGHVDVLALPSGDAAETGDSHAIG